MDVLERSAKQKIILSTFVATLMLAFLLFVGLMIWHANHLSGHLTTAHIEHVTLGPLTLADLSKTPLKTGDYAVTLQLSPGLWVYSTLWLLLTGGVSTVRLYVSRNRKNDL